MESSFCSHQSGHGIPFDGNALPCSILTLAIFFEFVKNDLICLEKSGYAERKKVVEWRQCMLEGLKFNMIREDMKGSKDDDYTERRYKSMRGEWF